jgi:hypothetical protein
MLAANRPREGKGEVVMDWIIRARGLPLAACLLTAGLLAFPAWAGAATKFGAKLRNANGSVVEPVGGNDCQSSSDLVLSPGACTRIPYRFIDPGAIQGHSKAPKNGRLKALKLVANDPGQFRFFLGRTKNLNSGAGTGKGKVTRRGANIVYDGSEAPYTIETFGLGGLRVRKGERIAIRGDHYDAERCTQAGNRQLLFQPPLTLNAPFALADASDNSCTMLVQVVYKH